MYYRPKNINEAITTLSKGELTIAAGCTDLFPTTQEDSLGRNILDISAIKSLKSITIEKEFRRIGSGVTWTDLENEELPNCYEMLKECSLQVGSRQIQNLGTIGGNLCNASPAADGVPCLLSLDASVELISTNGKRILKLDDFIKGSRNTELKKNEIEGHEKKAPEGNIDHNNFEKLENELHHLRQEIEDFREAGKLERVKKLKRQEKEVLVEIEKYSNEVSSYRSFGHL